MHTSHITSCIIFTSGMYTFYLFHLFTVAISIGSSLDTALGNSLYVRPCVCHVWSCGPALIILALYVLVWSFMILVVARLVLGCPVWYNWSWGPVYFKSEQFTKTEVKKTGIEALPYAYSISSFLIIYVPLYTGKHQKYLFWAKHTPMTFHST